MLSIVIPVHNEEENISSLLEELLKIYEHSEGRKKTIIKNAIDSNRNVWLWLCLGAHLRCIL